jgi:Sensors of blue-light using FAD
MNAMPNLIHLAYVSEATTDVSTEAIRTILDVARKNNASLDVTGVLLLVGRSFFQILEGEPDTVTALFEKIGRNKAHRRVMSLIREPIAHRDFATWSMGFNHVSAADLGSFPGFNDFFTTRKAFNQMNEGLARTLLTAFREGRFRAHAGD